MLSWSVLLRYQLVRRYDVSNWSVLFTYQWDVTKTSQIGSPYWRTSLVSWWCLSMVRDVQITLCRTLTCYAVYLFGASGGSVSLRYQLLRCYNVSKTSVSFRYELWCLCNVLKWSVSLRYQLVRRYDFSNWSILFTYQWDVPKTSQVGMSQWRTSCDVVMTSQHGPRHPDLYET